MFTHLHVHSNFSFCRGANTLEDLTDATAARGMDALALTDINGLYGAVWFVQCARERGLRPILGADLRTGNETAVVLARNREGYSRLCRIVTRLKCEPGFSLKQELLDGREHLVVLSHDLELLAGLAAAGGASGLFVELCHPAAERPLIAWSRRTGVPVVATNDVYFVDAERFAFHRLLRAIALNTCFSRLPEAEVVRPDQWLQPPDLMERRYPHLPAALDNAASIAETCAAVEFGDLVFPPFQPADGSDVFELLRERCYRGAEWRYGELPDPVVTRLERELAVIRDKGFASYFLVVQDIVRQSRRTCGRGSAAASLVSYCLGITHVEPISHDLFFERFLNEGRTDPPDIDVDFPWDERDAVLDYVFRKYGPAAAMIANQVGFRARAAVREVAKVYGIPETEIKAVTERMGYYWSLRLLPERIELDPVYKDLDLPPPWPEIVSWAVKLDGYPRNLSVHCGGVVIVPDSIDRYVPAEPAPKGVRIIQWEKDQAEDAGLIKIDLLGNRSLAVIRDALAAVRENSGVEIPYETWDPTTDAKTRDLIARGDTVGVFYAESPSMRQLQQKCRTGDFDRLVIHSSIIRPAANTYIREYVRRLHGGAYAPLHPLLEEVLGETFGIMAYQEDVSKVAMALAGFGASDADMLRKVLSKKRTGTRLEDYRNKFYAGAAARGVARPVVEQVWDMILSFSGYSFCKPHSASYALVSFKSAYLRAHHPAEFMAAVLSNQGGYYSTFAYVSEARRMGLKVLPPDVNASVKHYRGRGGTIRVGLMQLKDLKQSALDAVLEARVRGGYASLEDLLERTDIDVSDARVLIKSGALDCIAQGASRPELIWKALAWNAARKARRPAARSLFPELDRIEAPRVPQYSPRTVLEHELESLGFLLSRHPLTLYEDRLRPLRTVRAADLEKHVGRRVSTAGWWVSGKVVTTHDDEPMEFITFEDTTALYETTFFPEAYRKFCHILNRSRPYVLTGTVEEDYGAVTLTVDSIRLV